MKVSVIILFSVISTICFASPEPEYGPQLLNQFIENSNGGLSVDKQGNVAYSDSWRLKFDNEKHSVTYSSVDSENSKFDGLHVVRFYGSPTKKIEAGVSNLTKGIITYHKSYGDTLNVALLSNGKISSVTSCAGAANSKDMSCFSVDEDQCDLIMKSTRSKNPEDFFNKVLTCSHISNVLRIDEKTKKYVKDSSEATFQQSKAFLKNDEVNNSLLKDRELNNLSLAGLPYQDSNFIGKSNLMFSSVAQSCMAIKGFSSEYAKTGWLGNKTTATATFEPKAGTSK